MSITTTIILAALLSIILTGSIYFLALWKVKHFRNKEKKQKEERLQTILDDFISVIDSAQYLDRYYYKELNTLERNLNLRIIVYCILKVDALTVMDKRNKKHFYTIDIDSLRNYYHEYYGYNYNQSIEFFIVKKFGMDAYDLYKKLT